MFLDEPEAFLHPPQARLLGRSLGRLTKNGRQVICATHSSAVVHGLLQDSTHNVTVVRLQRQGDVNRASVLGHDAIRDLWNDTLLRHSNVLDGLFHRGVVVSESDSDSRFFSACLEECLEREELPASDLLFTQSGGKQRLRKVITALAL